ncbi:ATP synthase subunit O, mitochondrial [Bacillus rossius redtenbacheri]|uniref:ATP synthase subunit O, mitochondrial n=1 Tax=Bacillus rossius redtenbacheri TaxID=93214 RepID=UPI002FDF0277
MAAPGCKVLARCFSSSSVQQQLVKTPIQVFGLDGRYATALYSAATKMKQLDAVETDLLKFQGQLKTDTKLREFIANPIVKRSIKANAMKEVCSKMAMSAASANLFGLLAENGRLKSLDSIINAFKVIMAAHRGEVPCEVITSKPLDEAQRKDLEVALKGFMKQGQTLLLSAKVDPAILGGMVVSIGDKYIDMSIASKIKKYTELITTPV